MATDPAQIPQFAPAEHRPARRQLWEKEQQSAAVRLMIGDAIGDAFGFGVEMQDAYWIRKAVTRFDTWPDNPVLIPAYRENNVRGFYSDDAEMTVGLMKALVSDGLDLDSDGMMRAWKAEWDIAKARPPPAIAGGERQGHGSVGYFWRGQYTIESVRERQAKKDDPGNAPPMRALPLAFLAAAQRERLSVANADATHPHPKARAASLLVASAARHLVVCGGKPAAVLSTAAAELRRSTLSEPATLAHLAALEALPDYHTYGARFCAMPPEVHALLCGPQPCPHTLGVPQNGPTPMHGLYTDAMRTAGVVLYLLKWHGGALDVLQASVDIGGDVDSVAALALGVVAGSPLSSGAGAGAGAGEGEEGGGQQRGGLRFGEEGGLPWALLEELEGVEYLVRHAKAFDAWLATHGTPKCDEDVPCEEPPAAAPQRPERPERQMVVASANAPTPRVRLDENKPEEPHCRVE